MAITFPSSPSPGDIFTSNGKSWQYVNGKWESYGETVAPDVFAVDAANDVVYVYGSLSAGASASVGTDLIVGGDLTVDTSTLHVDSTNNRVGIGTSSPARSPLHIHKPNTNATEIHLTNAESGSTSSDGLTIFYDDATNGAGIWMREAGPLRLATSGSEKMRIDSSGNVGIGTTNPGALLHVSSGTSGDAEIRIQADSDNDDENDNPILTFMQDGSAFSGVIGLTNNQLNIVNASNASQGIKMGVVAANTTSGQDAIASMTTPALEITPGNNVKVNGDLTVFGSIYHDVSGAASSDPVIWVDGENIDVPLIRVGTDQWSTSSDHGFTIQYNGSGSGNLNSLQILADGETAANQINALTVTQNGRIGLGAGNPQAALHISNNTTPLVYVRHSTNGAGARIQFSDQSTEAQKGYMTYYHADGSSYGHGNAFVFDSTESTFTVVSTDDFTAVGTLTEGYSDERLKTIHGTIPNALEKLSGIRGYLYTQNEIADSLGFKEVGVQQVGVSAQEVMAVLPEVVTVAPISYTDKTEEEYYTVRYERMIPLLIETIHELTARIEALESAP